MSMIQIGILGMAGVLFAVQLKGQKAELAVFVCIGISLLIFCNLRIRLQPFGAFQILPVGFFRHI